MFKGTPELIEQRRAEIVAACEQLYQTKSFKDITLKEIGEITAFSRPTIYNYYQTKEEIFLDLFKQEYDKWNAELVAILEDNNVLTGAELADKIATSLEHREQLLKLLSMNNYDMEANSRPELLTEFKRSYGASMQNVAALLEKFCPEMSDAERQRILYTFFPFMFGIYPYAVVSEKQRTAMEDAQIAYQYQTVYEITYACLCRLLGVQ